MGTSGPQKKTKGEPETMGSWMNQANLSSQLRIENELGITTKTQKKQRLYKSGESSRTPNTQKLSCNHLDPIDIYRILPQ